MATNQDVDLAFQRSGTGKSATASDYSLYTGNPFFADAGKVEGDIRAGGGGVTAPGGGSSFGDQPTIDLPGMYTSLSEKAGVGDLQKELSTKEQGYNTAMSQINDNPYLSEANRVGRGARLTSDYQADAKTTQDRLTLAQADVQNQLNLQTEQFNINSQQAQLALSKFNSLLAAGALDGASAQDIASITKSTGISTGMIQSAIKTQVERDTPTSVQTVDDGKNTYAVTLNTKTGEVINKQVVGPSTQQTPTALSSANINGTQYQVLTNTQTGAIISKTPLGPATVSGGGGTSSRDSAGLTATEERNVTSAAASALQLVDTNGATSNGVIGNKQGVADKLISYNEYVAAVQYVIEKAGVDASTADDYVTQEFQTLGYKKWNW